MKHHVFAAILVLGSTAAVAMIPPSQQEVAESSSEGLAPQEAEGHGDGVSTRASISLSEDLLTDKSGNQVRAVSYAVTFLSSGRVSLARMHGLKVMDASSSSMFQEDIRGIFPDLMSASPSLEPHAYTVHVNPEPGATWGDVTANDVVISVVRKE